MEYIDKTVLQEEGEVIIRSFLYRLKIDGANYPRDLYEAFKSDKDEAGAYSKNKLIDVLLKEQNYHCCYCMRRLAKEDKVTLEHLITNGTIEREKFVYYFKRKTVLDEKVCLASDFISHEYIEVPPFPHTIAYQNLTVSCNGQIKSESKTVYCCNLKREEKPIEPIVLYNTIRSEVSYKQNGRAVWNKEQELLPTLNKLGLNDGILQMIRRIWIYCKNKEVDLDSVERKTILYSILSEFSDEEFKNKHMSEFNMLFNFHQDSFWNLLKEYSYFGE